MPKKRITWIDTVKFICIMFVMLSHLESRTIIQYLFYDPFFLACFFFVSGYVYKPNNNFNNFLYKKFRGLFIPWLFFSNFNILLSHLISFNSHGSISQEMLRNLLQVRSYDDGVWFVAALFITFIPFYFFIDRYEKSSKSNKSITLIAISFAFSFASIFYEKNFFSDFFPWQSTALPWHLEYIFQANFFMVLGYLYRTKSIEEKVNPWKKPGYAILGWILYIVIAFTPYNLAIHIPQILSMLLNYVLSILGVSLIISLAQQIPSNKYIAFVGQNTLIYFALHGKCYSIIQTCLHRFAQTPYQALLDNTLYSSLTAIVITIILSVILIIPAKFINRYLPFIMGKK